MSWNIWTLEGAPHADPEVQDPSLGYQSQDLDLNESKTKVEDLATVAFVGIWYVDPDSYMTESLSTSGVYTTAQDASALITGSAGPQMVWQTNDFGFFTVALEQNVDTNSAVAIGAYFEATELYPGLVEPVYLTVFDGTNPTLTEVPTGHDGASMENYIYYSTAEADALDVLYGQDLSVDPESFFTAPIEEMAKEILVDKPNAQITFKSISYSGFKSKQLSETSKEETQETALTTSLTYTTPTTSY